MRSVVTILGLVVTLGCRQAAPPQQQIDVAGIGSELLVIGQAEGHYVVARSTYATLEQLQQDSLLKPPPVRAPATLTEEEIFGGRTPRADVVAVEIETPGVNFGTVCRTRRFTETPSVWFEVRRPSVTLHSFRIRPTTASTCSSTLVSSSPLYHRNVRMSS